MQISNINSAVQEPISYRQRLKNRFRQQVLDIVNKYALTEIVIVLDSTSAFLLSNIFTITQLVGMKITYIQKLEVKRKKLDKHAIYFINPTKTSIQLLVNDFPDLKEQEMPQYKKVHILFTTFIDKGLLKVIAQNKNILKRIAKKSLKQFYFSSRIMAPNVVDLNIPYLGLAFSKPCELEVLKRQQICKKLIQFIANFDKINTVRIFYKKSPNMVCQRIAESLQQTVKNYLGILLQNRSLNINKSAPDLTILMLDRSIDTVTPFIHYFTYQALLFDFFTISMVTKNQLKDKGSYSYEQIQDSIYDQYRYQHIAQALAKLPQALQNQKGRLQNLKTTGHQSINIKDLSDRVGEIKTNIQKLQAIWKQFQERKIQQLADLEQSIATGITSDSQNTSSVKLIGDVIAIIKQPNIGRQQKLRLAILCIACIKMCKQDYEGLLNLFSNEDKKILKNMIALGASYDGSISKSTKTVTKDQQKIAQKRMKDTQMHLNRYTSIIQLVVPLFCSILEDAMHAQTIDKQVFGELVCTVFKQADSQRLFKRTRFAVAMIGGLSWSQVSAIRSIPDLNNIVLMSDSIMTAPQFLTQLSKINILSQ